MTNIQNKQLELQDMMLHRVHEILLIASPYDAFILEEDGRLTEQVLNEYLEMNFYQSPRVWRAETGKKALRLIRDRNFDVIIVMLRLADINLRQLCRKIKQYNPGVPILLLLFDMFEIEDIPEDQLYKSIDKVFVWKGNSNVFPAMMKYVEDQNNARRDILKGSVRAIIFIEDNPRYYSLILPLLYKEIMFHTKKLERESLDSTNRLLHLRGRTKVLLASTFEQAKEYFTKYRENIIGVISDVRFPKKGNINISAGIQFAKYIRKTEPYLPIVIQSSNLEYREKANSVNADFLYKHSKSLLKDLRKFMIGNFGFGDFIFRTPSGEEINRSRNIQSLYDNLQNVPQESILFHSKYNHFSNWLANRGEFSVASKIRPVYVDDFDDLEDLRKYLLNSIKELLEIQHDKHIIDFSIDKLKLNIPFLRIGKGSLGGKARGLLFMNRVIKQSDLSEKYPDINIKIPKTVVIGTGEFDNFISNNNLLEPALALESNEEITKLFLSKSLSPQLIDTLRAFLNETYFPIAVRSSSLLEDSQFQPLAGLYSTYMLPNSSSNLEDRLNQVCESIIRIYASTYFNNPKTLVLNTTHRIEEEKMAIIIMELVGQKFGSRYYPTISGVTKSINYYPISYMDRGEGIANVALGFGKGVVEGEKSLRFSPIYPNILPQYFSINETIKSSQSSFYALDLEPNNDLLKLGEQFNLSKLDLKVAEEDGQLFWVGSVVLKNDNIIRDSLRYTGTRVITFSQILKWNQFPLAEILIDLLKIGKSALGNPVEIEFSINLDRKTKITDFYILQIRPMSMTGFSDQDGKILYEKKNLICKSTVSLGNGNINNIKDIIYVDIKTFSLSKTRQIAQEIEHLNSQFNENRQYLLIGPGRWGSADDWLGIPVDWNQISNAKAIVEVGLEDLPIDPSFGTHFFQNITGMRIGYYTINHKNRSESINHKILKKLDIIKKLDFITWFHSDKELLISINGATGEGIIAKPTDDIMDEELSSGI